MDALARPTIAELERSLAEKVKEIESEKEERRLDLEHWEALSEQRLARLKSEVSGRFAHEINEARICLSGESPNIRMALARLGQMENWLAKLRAK